MSIPMFYCSFHANLIIIPTALIVNLKKALQKLNKVKRTNNVIREIDMVKTILYSIKNSPDSKILTGFSLFLISWTPERTKLTDLLLKHQIYIGRSLLISTYLCFQVENIK